MQSFATTFGAFRTCTAALDLGVKVFVSFVDFLASASASFAHFLACLSIAF
jgi:hypothetical protein